MLTDIAIHYGTRIRPIVINPSASMPAEWETVDGVLLDVLMQAHGRYGVHGSVYLLRPDTVVAARRVGQAEAARCIDLYVELTE